ncbi:MAG: hypothetical protein J0I06_07365 [Planctomycetes bacterium]|nr:hypothetical protein [Planctomycetota bacterium]
MILLTFAVAALVPFVIFVFLLDYFGLLPLSRFLNWMRGLREAATARAEKRAGETLSVEAQYRVRAVRATRVTKPTDLLRPVNRLVRELERVGGRRFTLYGYDAVREVHRVRRFGFGRVARFLAESEIRWNFGRCPSDPTHELVFFTRFNGTCAVYLRIAFIAGDAPMTGAGLVAELRVTPLAAGRSDAERNARVLRLRQVLVDALATDVSYVAYPGEPGATDGMTDTAF